MFGLFKKSEYEEVSGKIKNKNYEITSKFNKDEFKKFSKLSLKNQKEYLKELIEGISGTAKDYWLTELRSKGPTDLGTIFDMKGST